MYSLVVSDLNSNIPEIDSEFTFSFHLRRHLNGLSFERWADSSRLPSLSTQHSASSWTFFARWTNPIHRISISSRRARWCSPLRTGVLRSRRRVSPSTLSFSGSASVALQSSDQLFSSRLNQHRRVHGASLHGMVQMYRARRPPPPPPPFASRRFSLRSRKTSRVRLYASLPLETDLASSVAVLTSLFSFVWPFSS